MEKRLSLSPLNFMTAKKIAFNPPSLLKALRSLNCQSPLFCSITSLNLNQLNGYTVNYITSNYSRGDVRQETREGRQNI